MKIKTPISIPSILWPFNRLLRQAENANLNPEQLGSYISSLKNTKKLLRLAIKLRLIQIWWSWFDQVLIVFIEFHGPIIYLIRYIFLWRRPKIAALLTQSPHLDATNLDITNKYKQKKVELVLSTNAKQSRDNFSKITCLALILIFRVSNFNYLFIYLGHVHVWS